METMGRSEDLGDGAVVGTYGGGWVLRTKGLEEMNAPSGFYTGVERNEAEITVTVILGRLSFSSCNNPVRFVIAVFTVWMNRSRFLKKKVWGTCHTCECLVTVLKLMTSHYLLPWKILALEITRFPSSSVAGVVK